MASREELLTFLEECRRRVETETLSPTEQLLLQQYFLKSKLVQSGKRVEDDDWDYISLGIFLRSVMRSQNDDECNDDECNDTTYASHLRHDLNA